MPALIDRRGSTQDRHEVAAVETSLPVRESPFLRGQPVKRFELLEMRLERWARWRKDADSIPTGGYHNPLAALHGEGAEMDRSTVATKSCKDSMNQVRDSLKRRLKEAKASGDDVRVARLKRQLKNFPSTIAAMPWASLIHGTGARPDPDCPEEEETELAVAALMESLKRVVHIEFRMYGPQPDKAKKLGYSRATYQRRLYEALTELKYRLT